MATTGPTWSKHFHHIWQERSGDPRLPTWLRIASAAYGMHGPNGHAIFKRGTWAEPGHLAVILGEPQLATGAISPATRHVVNRAIDKAVEFGWLAPGSHSGCLIVPQHAVVNGLGDPGKFCPVDHQQARRKHDQRSTSAGETVHYRTPFGGETVSPGAHAGALQDTVSLLEAPELLASEVAPSLISSNGSKSARSGHRALVPNLPPRGDFDGSGLTTAQDEKLSDEVVPAGPITAAVSPSAIGSSR